MKRKRARLNNTSIPSNNEMVLKKQVEESSEQIHKCNYVKQKFEEDKAMNLRKKGEKRKRLLYVKQKEILRTDQNSENISKTNHTMYPNSSSNLFNYFNKVTPEQVEQERLKKTRITVKAEIHNPQDIKTSDLSHINQNQKHSESKKHVNSIKLENEYNEICVLQTETLVVLPNNEKLDLCHQYKPKWSLKVQLQPNGLKELDTDDEMYTPTASSMQLEKNLRNFKSIPKVLLPITSNKTGQNKSSKEKVETNVATIKAEIQKNESIPTGKTGVNFNLKNRIIHNYGVENTITNSFFDKRNVSKKTGRDHLAPLFFKRLKSSLEVEEAQKLFPQPECNKYVEKKTIMFELIIPKVLAFPKVSHINQETPNVEEIQNRPHKVSRLSEKKLFKTPLNYSVSKTIPKSKNHNSIYDRIYEFMKADIDLALTELETSNSNVLSLWEKILKVSKSKNCKPTVVKVEQKEIYDQSSNFSNTSCLWTEKYKPNSSREIVDNEESVLKLKTWLRNWQPLKVDEDYSSSEEFYASDCSLSSDVMSNQVAVLIGPHGIGKTASVYAVAQELGYTVLELNASSKRSGKQILKEFEEATKSHRVKNFNMDNSFEVSLCETQKNNTDSKKSLIFIEDVDLIFEEDDGFVSATFQLASKAKRPIVMTLRNACVHLPKIAPQQLRINFEPVVGEKMLVLLQLIVLAETGYQLPQSCLNALCQDGDLRRSLLQLQYLLLSKKQHISHRSLVAYKLSWKSMEAYIYKPAKKDDDMKGSDSFEDHEIVNKISRKLDHFAIVSNLIKIEDHICSATHVQCEPSTSFIQNPLPHCSLISAKIEIGTWMVDSIKNTGSYKEKTNESIDATLANACIPIKDKCIMYTSSILTKIVSSLDKSSVALDYLPSIRNICRAELVRNQLNSKRGNRFFHYLHTSRLSNGNVKLDNVFSTACKMLQLQEEVN